MTALLVALAGGLGAVARMQVDGALRTRYPAIAPWQTAVVNVSGSFLVGLIAGLFHGQDPAGADDWYAVAATGFCGGYTTMSTASVDVVTLIGERRPAAAARYAAVTLVLALAACAAGMVAGRALG